MRELSRHAVTYSIVGACLLGALLINVYVLPGNNLVSSLYAVPVLIAAQRLSPRAVGAVDAAAILLYLLNAYIKERPLVVQPFGVIALLAIGYLAVLLAVERGATLRRAREAEHARRGLQEFVGMASHDLAQPLTTVRGYVQLLGRLPGRRSEAEQRAINGLQESSLRMQRLVDDLRDAASIGAGRFQVRREPTDLVAVVRQVVEQQQATTQDHELELQAPPELEVNVDGDRVGQLLTNLISNAIKYSPQGGRVRVGIEKEDGKALVDISDAGPGIAPEAQELLFRPFSRLDTEQRGTGLGLYISKAIAESHGGRIWVRSRPGEGSTFSVSLPV